MLQHPGQKRKIGNDGLAFQRAFFETQEDLGGTVGVQNKALGIDAQDGSRAGLDERPEILFGLLPQVLLSVQFLELSFESPAILAELRGEQAGHGEATDHQDHLRIDSATGRLGQPCQRRAEPSHQQHLPSGQKPAPDDDRVQIKKS